MKSFAKVIAATVFIVPALASAVDSAPLPKPISEMECLVGAWKGGGMFSAGTDKAKLSASWDCKRTSARQGVLCQLRMQGIPGMASYEETDLFGWEPNTNTYHWFSVTNAGEVHDHVAKVPTNENVQFVFNGVQEGKPFKEVVDLTFAKDGKTVVGRGETFVNGVSTSLLEMTLHK